MWGGVQDLLFFQQNRTEIVQFTVQNNRVFGWMMFFLNHSFEGILKDIARHDDANHVKWTRILNFRT